MNPTTLPGLQPFEYAFVADSGRLYLVKVAHVGPVGEGQDFEYTLGQADSTGAFIGQPVVLTKSVHRDGIAARTHGYTDFWKFFANVPGVGIQQPTITPPANLATPGPTVVDGANWYAGRRDTTKNTADPNVLCPTLGARGDWYVDLDTGHTWKKRQGELEYMAFKAAEFMEHAALGDESIAGLAIPKATQPTI